MTDRNCVVNNPAEKTMPNTPNTLTTMAVKVSVLAVAPVTSSGHSRQQRTQVWSLSRFPVTATFWSDSKH